MASALPAKLSAQAGDHPAKAKVFISYSRRDMAFADRLELALKARGFSATIDRTEIYALEEWWKRIQTLITRADTMIFVLSPDSVVSKEALKEVAFAASLNKRFAPIVCRQVDDKVVPEALAKLNFVFFDDESQFEKSADRLAQALNTDIAWIRQHTDFGEAARHWSLANQPNGLLLRSPVLEEAERWIAARPDGAPPPTEETSTFIRHSRQAATRRRNVLTASLTAGLMLALALAGVAYWQFQTAQQNFGIARETADNMIESTAQGLRNVQGMNIATIDMVLAAIDKSVDKLKESHRDNPLIDLSRAAVAFEFAKTYQAADNRAAALKKATESFEIRAKVTKYDQREASPRAFEASSADSRWELSTSLELIGDLKRKEANERGAAEEQKRLRQEALKWFSDALAVRRPLANTSPDRENWAIGISHIFVRLGDLSSEEGKAETAVGYYEQSLHNAAQFFARRPKSTALRRELSWNFNKVGDIKLRAAERKARSKEPFRELTEAALSDFNNSLCIRRKLATIDPRNLLFKRDVSYALRRIGDARRLRQEASAAEAAYFEALIISLELRDNDDRNMDYVDDVAASLQKVGDLYREAAPEYAFAFYQYAGDLRASTLQWAVNRNAAQAKLQAIQEIVEAMQSRIDPERRAGLTGLWWRPRVSEAIDHFAIQQAGHERDPDACWNAVTTSVETIVGAARTATLL
jgi:TIR domain-containing protein